mmetsp:Transcript_4366/g.12823  ORF Transcript_4366/g.12823 Transcript_4366/m.12823 type:complete len:111 (+) Transcript_4366:2899-3231(+)
MTTAGRALTAIRVGVSVRHEGTQGFNLRHCPPEHQFPKRGAIKLKTIENAKQRPCAAACEQSLVDLRMRSVDVCLGLAHNWRCLLASGTVRRLRGIYGLWMPGIWSFCDM